MYWRFIFLPIQAFAEKKESLEKNSVSLKQQFQNNLDQIIGLELQRARIIYYNDQNFIKGLENLIMKTFIKDSNLLLYDNQITFITIL